MKKLLLIIFFLTITQTSYANSIEYKGLEKLSKNI